MGSWPGPGDGDGGGRGRAPLPGLGAAAAPGVAVPGVPAAHAGAGRRRGRGGGGRGALAGALPPSGRLGAGPPGLPAPPERRRPRTSGTPGGWDLPFGVLDGSQRGVLGDPRGLYGSKEEGPGEGRGGTETGTWSGTGEHRTRTPVADEDAGVNLFRGAPRRDCGAGSARRRIRGSALSV